MTRTRVLSAAAAAVAKARPMQAVRAMAAPEDALVRRLMSEDMLVGRTQRATSLDPFRMNEKNSVQDARMMQDEAMGVAQASHVTMDDHMPRAARVVPVADLVADDYFQPVRHVSIMDLEFGTPQEEAARLGRGRRMQGALMGDADAFVPQAHVSVLDASVQQQSRRGDVAGALLHDGMVPQAHVSVMDAGYDVPRAAPSRRAVTSAVMDDGFAAASSGVLDREAAQERRRAAPGGATMEDYFMPAAAGVERYTHTPRRGGTYATDALMNDFIM